MRKPMVVLFSLLAGMFVFLTACEKEYSVEVTKIGAEGSLQDSTGNCLQDSVVGTYYGGVTPGSDTAYLQVKVNVTKAGSYTIYTDKQNGMSFTDSGYFSATGLTTIKLKPVGAPILPGSFDYNVTFDSTVCYFTLAVQDSTGTGLGGNTGGGGGGGSGSYAWQFTVPSGTVGGPSAVAYLATVQNITELSIQGPTSSGTETFSINLLLPNSNMPAAGTQYTTTGLNSIFVTNGAGFVYQAGAGEGESTITIDSYDASTKTLKGTFSGTIKDVAAGNIVSLTNGSFTAKLQ